MTEIKERIFTEEFKKSFFVNLKGKDFISFDGLMVIAHAEGMQGVETKVIQIPNAENDDLAIVHAVVTDSKGNKWSGTGDASPASVGKQIVSAIVRMAETRAIGRALRMMLGVGTMMEEIYDPYEPAAITDVQMHKIKKVMDDRQISKSEAAHLCYDTYKKKSAGFLTMVEADAFIELLRNVEIDEEDEDAGQ
jgi:hypothetical protein